MKKLLILFFVMGGILLSSCRKEMDVEIAPLNLKMLAVFQFRKADNPILKSDVKGTIVEAKKTITLTVPKGTNVTALKPYFINSPGSVVEPGNLIPQDFTNPVDFTVTAPNGTSIYYTVTVIQ